MGNEFGHPEWIDFPREGNNWSFKYARRLWQLMDDSDLKYRYLARFDREMVSLAQNFKLLETPNIHLLHEHSDDKVVIFERAGLILAFNFHPQQSFTDYRTEAPPGKYRMIFTSDAPQYGGHDRLVPGQEHFTLNEKDQDYDLFYLSLYLPSRTTLVLQKEKRL
jgi:1,4-alpha-glucan branching enzyme